MTPSPTLPDHLTGAYTQFNAALEEHHGLTVRPLRYLRLTIEAASTPGHPTHGGRTVVELLIDGRRIRCVYDPRGSGALVTAYRPRVELPRGNRTCARADHNVSTGGKRRKRKRRTNKAARRARAYKRPCPGGTR